jgi:hypothetical protein
VTFLHKVSSLNPVCNLRATIEFKVVLERCWPAKIWGVVFDKMSVVHLEINATRWFP